MLLPGTQACFTQALIALVILFSTFKHKDLLVLIFLLCLVSPGEATSLSAYLHSCLIWVIIRLTAHQRPECLLQVLLFRLPPYALSYLLQTWKHPTTPGAAWTGQSACSGKYELRFTPINVHIKLINNCHQHVKRGVTDRHMIRQLNHQRNSWHLNQTVSCEKHKLNCLQNICYNSPKTSGNVHYLKKSPRKMENNNEIKSLIWIHFRSVTDNIVCSLSHLKEPSQKMTPFNETLWPHQHRGVESFKATVWLTLNGKKKHTMKRKLLQFFKRMGVLGTFVIRNRKVQHFFTGIWHW